ncbi:predicted protein [Plenodomus lingam JN3]|uniref:Predicted protein n=2 Tax=Leptosphaeria maculans TaxID=5022 RepID=E4ZMY8_LEPMJ|nr:predicted protein [Plenodomus lingam JN3]CBX92591.1 predicted protein [Plenodomus lingam JN3]
MLISQSLTTVGVRVAYMASESALLRQKRSPSDDHLQQAYNATDGNDAVLTSTDSSSNCILSFRLGLVLAVLNGFHQVAAGDWTAPLEKNTISSPLSRKLETKSLQQMTNVCCAAIAAVRIDLCPTSRRATPDA